MIGPTRGGLERAPSGGRGVQAARPAQTDQSAPPARGEGGPGGGWVQPCFMSSRMYASNSSWRIFMEGLFHMVRKEGSRSMTRMRFSQEAK